MYREIFQYHIVMKWSFVCVCSIVKKKYYKVHGQEIVWITFQELVMLEIQYVSFVDFIKCPVYFSYLKKKKGAELLLKFKRFVCFTELNQ